MRTRTPCAAILALALILALGVPSGAFADADDDIPGATTVAVGGSAEGSVDAVSDKDDVWAIPLTAGEEVTITVEPTTTDGDADATLLAAGISSLAQADDYGIVQMSVTGGVYIVNVFRRAYTPTLSANYYIWVSCDGDPLGYRISVERTINPSIVGPDSDDIPGIPIGLGSVTGIVDGRTDFTDVYKVKLLEGQPVTFRMEAANNSEGNGGWLNLLDPDSTSVLSPSTYSVTWYNGSAMYDNAFNYSPGGTPDKQAVLEFVPPSTAVYYLWIYPSNLYAYNFPYVLTVEGHAEIPVGDALDSPDLSWETTGDAGWTDLDVVSHDGVDGTWSSSLGSPGIGTTVTGPGTLTWWWMMNADLNDRCAFWDNLKRPLGGGLYLYYYFDWRMETYRVPEGEHTLAWTFERDGFYWGPKYVGIPIGMYLDQVSLLRALPDEYSVAQDTPLEVTLPGVLWNDTDSDGDFLTAVRVHNPAHGTLSLVSDGSFTYTPAAGWSGTDSFTYTANDGQVDSNVTTVTVTVTGPEPLTIDLEHDAAGVVFDRFVTGYSTAYSGGGYVYGRWTGTVLKAAFTGSSIRWVGPKQPSYGMADVWIDGAKVASDVDCYQAAPGTLSATIWESATLTDGPHTIELRLIGHKNAASTGYVVVLDKFEVTGASPTGLGTRYDDSTASPGYTGTWLPYANPTYFNKTYAYSRWTNAAFTLSFSGTRVSWIGPRTPNYGIADVYIDSVKVATVDTYRANLATQGWREVVWQSGTLAAGPHTISIRPTGTKNAAATAANVVIDAIDVVP